MTDIALAASAIVLSPYLQVFFQRMASGEFNVFFKGQKLSNKLLTKLEIALLSMNAVLEDAEYKQFMNPDVKKWLDRVKDAVYDAEDILDKIATKELRLKLEAKFGTPSGDIWNRIPTFASQVWTTFSTSSSVKEVEREIEELLEKLELLLKKKENLGLSEDVGGKPLERDPTTSLVDESSIFGRHDDKDAIINSLLSDSASGDGMGAIVLVGMGGIGKTTIAQLVYNDYKLKERFDLKVWVCVSDEFNVLKLTKTILEEVGLCADSNNLNQLQIELKKWLTGKKILLVLDDVWNIKHAQWELLSIPFRSCSAQESRILITTRNQEVASVVFACETRCINELPKEHCWLLFEKYAFRNLKPDARQEREELGRQILKKCKGLPLAIKCAIGSLLGSKSNVKEWGDVLRSELWHLPIENTDILLPLSLSYKHLLPHLRRCFAYCSIFPKGYAFKKDTLVLLWMAEGLLPQLPNKTMEEVGNACFLALVSRSLFQRSNHNEYKMHDLISDLAKFISKEFTLSHEDGCSHEIRSNTRHFSFSSENFDIEKFEAFHRAKRLRTIVKLNFSAGGMLVGKGIQFSLPKLRCLRVLVLSHYENITELLDSIEELILLRHLDLSHSKIRKLPDSICNLCNLQILNLLYCRHLATLPRDMHKLVNLRHLNIAKTSIIEMPINLGELKCLQILSYSVVSKHSGSDIE